MRKKELELKLATLEPIENPIPKLEQYTTPANIAADILYIALGYGDIEGKCVIDLGCGNGIFAIGASLLGAEKVIAIDIDEKVLKSAKENAERLKIKNINWLTADIRNHHSLPTIHHSPFTTIIMNPPFGAQNRHADRPFLNFALNYAQKIYTLHLHDTESFIENFVTKKNARIVYRKNYKFKIPYQFKFHRKDKVVVDVTLFVIRNAEFGVTNDE